jgi:hypothetical protein
MINCPRCSKVLSFSNIFYECLDCATELGVTFIIYINENKYNFYSYKYRLGFSYNNITIFAKNTATSGYRKLLLEINKGSLNYSSFKSHDEIDSFVKEALIFS